MAAPFDSHACLRPGRSPGRLAVWRDRRLVGVRGLVQARLKFDRLVDQGRREQAARSQSTGPA